MQCTTGLGLIVRIEYVFVLSAVSTSPCHQTTRSGHNGRTSKYIHSCTIYKLRRDYTTCMNFCHLKFEFNHYILQVMIVLEFMSNGDLRDFLIQNRPRYLTLCRYFVINYIYISIPFCINYKVIKTLSSLTYLVAILHSHPCVNWLRITLLQTRSYLHFL